MTLLELRAEIDSLIAAGAGGEPVAVLPGAGATLP
jgi:hypothetical protein